MQMLPYIGLVLFPVLKVVCIDKKLGKIPKHLLTKTKILICLVVNLFQ